MVTSFHQHGESQWSSRASKAVPSLSLCLLAISSLSLSPVLLPRAVAQPAPRPGNSAGDKAMARTLFGATRKQANLALEAGDHTAALQLYEALLKQHPTLFSDSRALTFEEMAEVHLKAKQPEAALDVYERGLAALAPDAGAPDVSAYSLLRLINGKAQLLRGKRQFPEALALREGAYPLIVAAGQSAPGGWQGSRYEAARTLGLHAEMLRVRGKTPEAIALLSRFLSEVPTMLDEKFQRQNANHPAAPVYKAALSLLRRSKQHDAALSWAKLHFLTCDFETGAIERSTGQLGEVWAASENLAAVKAFDAAQADASLPNPLREVALPALDKARLREVLATTLRPLQKRNTQRWPQAVHDAITILVVLGEKEDLGLAMSLAKTLLLHAPDKPAGAREVCRVFKGADSGVARANQFLGFLEGKGDDPMLAFFQTYPEQPVSDARAGKTP